MLFYIIYYTSSKPWIYVYWLDIYFCGLHSAKGWVIESQRSHVLHCNGYCFLFYQIQVWRSTFRRLVLWKMSLCRRTTWLGRRKVFYTRIYIHYLPSGYVYPSHRYHSGLFYFIILFLLLYFYSLNDSRNLAGYGFLSFQTEEAQSAAATESKQQLGPNNHTITVSKPSTTSSLSTPTTPGSNNTSSSSSSFSLGNSTPGSTTSSANPSGYGFGFSFGANAGIG